MQRRVITVILLWCFFMGGAGAETVLTVEKVRRLAMENNRQFQSARKELDRSRGEIISARSDALPQINLNGRYARNIEKPALFFGGQKIILGSDNEFDFSLSLTQPLYAGGKVGSALKIARIYEEFSVEKVKEIESEVIFSAESMFYDAILAESNLEVIQSSLDLLRYNLEIVEKYYDQGMISEFELLRARVEKLNLEPQLKAAESRRNISRKRLNSFLGLPLEEEVALIADVSDTAFVDLPPLDTLVSLALKNRPEIKQAELQKKGYKKAVKIARGDWFYPNVDLNTTYRVSASSDDFRLNDREISRSWTASLLLNVPLFDGGRTIGEVRKARVDYYQAVLEEQQAKDDVRLEVEQVYDNLFQVWEALELQHETIEQAEEGMRIANLRYQSGVGTQLEVLSAQTALTEARTNLSRAIYSFRLAKSALRKATGYEIK